MITHVDGFAGALLEFEGFLGTCGAHANEDP